jgi:uncharacterized protein YbcI
MAPERTRELSTAGQISRGMVRLLSEYTGRGPTRARATVNTNMIAVVFEDALTKAEVNLVAAGQLDSVHRMRRVFHEVMRDKAIEAVSEITGRAVLSFLSDVDPEANVAAAVFLLDTQRETGEVDVAESGPDTLSHTQT